MTETSVRIRPIDLPQDDDLRVGLQRGKVGGDWQVATDAAGWRATVRRHPDGDVRGEIVQGKRGERFFYLVWQRDGASIGRSKIPFAAMPGAEHVRVTVSVTDDRGGYRTGTIKPERITWEQIDGV